MALDASFPQALAAVAAKLGVRQSWFLLVLYLESRLTPSAHRASSSFYGMSQLAASALHGIGINPDDYLTWSASQQLSEVIGPWYAAALAPLKRAPTSPGELYVANLAPAYMKPSLTSTTALYKAPSKAYTGNAPLDVNGDGVITPADLDAFMFQLAQQQPFKDALATLSDTTPPYSAAPISPMVSDFPFGRVLQLGLLGLAGGAVVGIALADRHARRARRNPDRPLLIATGALVAAAGVSSALLLLTRKPLASTPQASSAFSQAVLDAARKDVGVTESGDPSRVAAMLATYGLQGDVNWCAAAVGTWIHDAASALGVKPPIVGSASARTTGDQFQRINAWFPIDQLRGTPALLQPGMVVIWSRGQPGQHLGHIGVVSSVAGKGFFSIEGNSGPAADRVAEWQHNLDTSTNLLGAGYFPASAVIGAGYQQDPPGAALFDLPAPELD